MRVLVSVSAGLLMVALTLSGAKAQDAPYGNWHGLYFGGQVGYGWSDADHQIEEGEIERAFAIGGYTDSNGAHGPNTTRGLDGTFDGNYSSSGNGVLGGVHVGGLWQHGFLVFGAEADYDWSTVGSSTSTELDAKAPNANSTNTNVKEQVHALAFGAPIIGDPSISMDSELRGVASIRGRLGIASSRWLVYGTGGWGWSNASVSFTSHDPAGPEHLPTGNFTAEEFISGFVYGGGVEYMISRSVSLRAEVLHYDFGRSHYSFDNENTDTNDIESVVGSSNFDLTQVRAGISFHLN